jgi:probable rRNA maturation factor
MKAKDKTKSKTSQPNRGEVREGSPRRSQKAVRQYHPRQWRVHTTLECKLLKVDPKFLKQVAKIVLRSVDSEVALSSVKELHIMVINDARMREINFEYRNKDKATDVLSFPQFSKEELRTPGALGDYLGDIVLASQTTKRQAKSFGVSVKIELIRLVVHGILHLVGYDHEGVPAREAQAMRRKERILRGVVCSELGVN